MKKLFSAILASLLVLSSFSFVALAADEPIVVSPSQLDLNMDDNAGMTRTITTKDGIPVIKMEPNTSSSDYLVVDGYNISGRGVTIGKHLYASVDYYYETSVTDSTSNPVLGRKAELRLLKLKPNAETFLSDQSIQANVWTRVTFDLSKTASGYTNTSDGNTLNQYHFLPLGSETYGNNANGTIYVNNLTFHTEPVGIPTITGIKFAENEITIEKGYALAVPAVTVTGENSPIQDYTLTVSGHSSEDTVISGGSIFVGADETAESFTITATSVIDTTKSTTMTVKVKNPAPRTDFDADNVVIRFGVVSDVHQNGYYAGTLASPQPQEWAHTIDVLEQIAKDDGAKLDAILVAGDLVDGVANGGSNVGSFANYGLKAMQNMREVGHFAHGVWGEDTTVNFTKEVGIANETRSQYAPGQDIHVKATSVSGFGNGFDETTRLFYCLGNHDENGRGYTAPITKTIDGVATKFAPVWSADYFAAVICGWQYDYSSAEALSNTREGDGEYEDGTDFSYREYIADLIDYNTNPNTTVTAETFGAKFFTPLADADALFDRYYGHLDVETTLADKANGLSFGNMHMTIDPNPDNATTTDRIHFIAVELSQSNESCAWAEEIIKTSVEEDPSKPVFIISHYKPKGTMYGDTNYTRLSDVLKKYPQTIIWGGHSHTSMHNDNAINSELGFVAVETNTTRYMSTSTGLTLDAKFGPATSNNSKYPQSAYNYPSHEGQVSNACYVEVDKSNNVRIRRVDLYRSYSTDFAANPDFFTQNKYKNFNNHAYNEDFVAIDEPAFIRSPWDITDIETGKHLSDFNTTARTEKTGIPYFESSSLTAEGVIGGIDVKFTMNAKDDGMIMLYVLEVKNSDGDVVHRRYYTNFYYDYPQDPTATYAGNYIAERDITANISGLSPAEDYTVELFAVDDFYVPGEPISANARTPDGDTKIDLGDGKIGVYVDTTGEHSTYNVGGKDYLVYGSFKSAIAVNPDVIYFIQGNADLYTKQADGSYKQDIAGIKADTKIIGINRDKAVFNYNASYNTPVNLWFENVSFAKNDAGDTGLNLLGHTLTLVDVKASAHALNIFNTGWGGSDPSGTLIVKGDTGKIANVYPGPNYGANAGSKGDVSITLDGGTYETVGSAKEQSGNKIDGNVFITVTGGTYDTVRASLTSANHRITKNAVLKIFGGTIATVGSTGKTNVDGKDVIILTDAAKSAITTLNKADNQIVITVPDDVTDAIGEATADANGYYTAFAIKQIEGKKSFVNGVAATSIALTAGEEYVVTYKTPSAIEYDLNGGTGTAPEVYVGNTGDVVTELASGEGFSRENYTFAGWALTPDATDAIESVTITEDGVVLYAVWAPKDYTSVTLDGNGGAVEGEATVKAFVGENTVLPYAYKAKSVFVGWSADKNAEAGSMTYTAVEGTKEATLYAIYKEVGKEVIYVNVKATKNGNGHSSATPMNDFKAAMAAGSSEGTVYVLMSTTIVSETATVGNGFQSAKGAFTLTSTDPATGEKYESAAVFSTNGHYSTKSVTYDIPIASINHSGMHINAQGNNTYFTENAKFITKNEPIPGSTEVGSSNIYLRGRGESGTVVTTYYEFDDVDVVTSDIRLIANGSSSATTSTVVVNGGTIDKSFALNGNTYGTINLIVNGFGASDKALTLDGTGTIGVLNIVMNNDTSDTVKYSYSATPTSTYIVKSTSEGNVEPTATAGTFKITTEEDSIYVNGQNVELSADNLYALGAAGTYNITYDATPRHTVTYKANGGEGADVTKTVKEGAEIDLTEAPFTREGHTFLGWAEAADSNVTLASLTMGTADVTLYAIWKTDTYEVKFNANGGNAIGELAPLTKTYGEDLTLPTDYILYGTGLEFAGWSENPDATAEDIVTTYTANKATTFFAIYNNVGTAGVTPEDAIDGAYYVITESDDEVTAPEFEIPGTVTEVAKYDITLIDAATGDKLQPTGEISFKVTCDGIDGKAVYVYHVEEDAFEACTVTGNEVTFTTDTLSTFVIYTVEVKAQYKLVGQYNIASGFYTVSLYYNGEEANSGSFGFEYDDSVYTAFAGFEYADGIGAVIPTVREGNVITGTWYPSEGAYIGGNDEDVLIGTFTLNCLETDYDKSLAAERFYVYTGAEVDDETFNGQYYLYAPNAESSLEVVFAPIVAMDIVDLEPITVTYAVTGTLVTVREDGKAPVAPAKAVVTNAGGAKVAEFAIEDASTAVGKVGFEFECAPGTYKLSVIKNGYLEETVEFTVEGDMNIGEITPTAGDIRGKTTDAQGDGVIDLADFVRILRGFEAAELAAHVDINEDGAVNVTDLGYVKAGFGKTK